MEKQIPRQIAVPFTEEEWRKFEAFLAESGIIKGRFARIAILRYMAQKQATHEATA